ncbi:uncharacterized protein EI97DRAFT_38179 [Westerdykella ornata]|uniref:Steroid 5-alpha reductase C-terminal domain-containing protein n=1 Tax=Westerdykella ornata TaxID=318751 RepID=A0A6A6JKA6_WESOR|nr:uncharacterized protein EI97DRAFT_38179 [Westerdykella ornata]KAF2276398.1 hypothetical protein EI97DRAFT_38179 [Westerdykella ornata]
MAEKAASASGDLRSAASRAQDLITRGEYRINPVGTTLFVLLRSLDPLLQYSILAHGAGTALLHRVGLRTLPPGLPTHTGYPIIDNLGLSPYRLILLGMAVGSAFKHDIWAVAIGAEPMSPQVALVVSVFNTLVNSINSYAFLLSVSSASAQSTFPQPSLIVGSALYVTGILIELIAEVQRKRFKADPKNKGKPYTGGLWSFARHINYGAYTIWRAGYGTAAGGWALGILNGAFFFYNFVTRGVPLLNEYCEKRYGADWEAFKRQTKYALIPGIY